MGDKLQAYINAVKYYTNCYNGKTINHIEFMYHLQKCMNRYYYDVTEEVI